MEWLHIFSKLLLSNECQNGVRYFQKEDSYFSAVVLTRCFKKVKMCVQHILPLILWLKLQWNKQWKPQYHICIFGCKNRGYQEGCREESQTRCDDQEKLSGITQINYWEHLQEKNVPKFDYWVLPVPTNNLSVTPLNTLLGSYVILKKQHIKLGRNPRWFIVMELKKYWKKGEKRIKIKGK